jgi:hypothetical protein
MRITGQNTGANGLSSGSYYFKIDGATGVVTKNQLWDAPTTPYNTDSMNNLFTGNYDDNGFEVIPDWSVAFLGNTYNSLWFNGNNTVGFGSDHSDNGGNFNPNTGGTPCIVIANNDNNLQQVWSITVGTTGSRTLICKIRGNTKYAINSVNFDYDIYFYEATGNIDVVVNQEPTGWFDWYGGVGHVWWGVTNGSTWVDGLSTHQSSIGEVAGLKSGIRITGNGIRFSGVPAPVLPTVTIGTSDLAFVTSSNLSGNDYNYGGNYDYIVFTGDTALESALQSNLGMTAGNGADFKPFAASWAGGGNGYIYLQYTSDPLVQFYACDVDGNPISPGTYTFPLTISRV